MHYLEIKQSVAGLLRGDNSKAEELLADGVYISMALRDISMRCVPLKLLGNYDKTVTDLFRRVHSELNGEEETYLSSYLRKAIIDTADDAEVDIDEELTQAVIFFICSYLSNKKNESYVQLAEDVISFYNSNSVDLSQYNL